MKKSFRVFLKPGERLFVNGAVLRADRKVSIEFLNDVRFLLEAHVMQTDETTTPLRQLYFLIQTMLIDPAQSGRAGGMYRDLRDQLLRSLASPALIAGVQAVDESVAQERFFEALKTLRGLLPIEDTIIAAEPTTAEPEPEKEMELCR